MRPDKCSILHCCFAVYIMGRTITYEVIVGMGVYWWQSGSAWHQSRALGINIIIFYNLCLQMFDELYYNEENSLDLLLKFSTESQNPEHSPEYSFQLCEKELAPTNNNISSLIDLIAFPLESTERDTAKEVAEMKKAAEQQENKLKILFANKNKERPKTHLSLKRKISECTEAPNSPLRKTKAVRKEKS